MAPCAQSSSAGRRRGVEPSYCPPVSRSSLPRDDVSESRHWIESLASRVEPGGRPLVVQVPLAEIVRLVVDAVVQRQRARVAPESIEAPLGMGPSGPGDLED